MIGAKHVDSTLETDLLKSMSEVNDPAMRAVLALLLRTHKDIGAKLDLVLADESRIKGIVLNGFTEEHHAHHAWLEGHIKNSVVIKAVNAVHDDSGLCWYARQRIQEEKDNKVSARKVRDDLIGKLLWSAIALACGVLAGGFFGN